MPLVSGWVVFWNPKSLASFTANAAKIDEALPEWIQVDEDGMPSRRKDFDAERARFLVVARKHKVRVLGMASNFAVTGFDPDRMHRMLIDPAKRSAHASGLARIAREDGLAGIDLDYESLKAEDREPFSLFVETLARTLHRDGRTLSVTLHPKDNEPGYWDGPKAQDYGRIGKTADIVRLMIYDQHGPWSEYGPIASDEWAERCVRFASSRIPARKLELGVPAYGYDWGVKPPLSLVWEDRDATGAVVDPKSGELMKDRWRFGGSETFTRRRAMAAKFRMRGVTQWYIGSEDPEMWALIPNRPSKLRR